MKLGLAVEMSPKVFREQFTSCERMSHAASADSVLLSTWQVHTHTHVGRHFRTIETLLNQPVLKQLFRPYLEADVLQVVGVPLYDLLDEIRVCSFEVGARRLVKLKLKASPQLGHVERLVPPAAHLRGVGPIQQWEVLEDVQQQLLGKSRPVAYRRVAGARCLGLLARLRPHLLASLRWAPTGGAVAVLLSSFDALHPETWR